MMVDSPRTALTACTALLLATAAWSELAPAADLDRFEGEWTRSARERSDGDRAAAVDRAMEHMPFWARGFGRAVMRASITPPERYTIRVTPTGLSIAEDDGEPKAAFVDTQLDAADNVLLMERISDGTLRQHWRHSDDAYGTTLWTVTDARELIVSVEAYDARLHGADGELRVIRYATSYSLVSEATSALRPE
jgi:hypothetical protein